MNGFQDTTETYAYHVFTLQPFQQFPLWEKVNVVNRDPHCYTRRVKEAIHIRLHPNNINRDDGIEIPEAWMPTIKQHNS